MSYTAAPIGSVLRAPGSITVEAGGGLLQLLAVVAASVIALGSLVIGRCGN